MKKIFLALSMLCVLLCGTALAADGDTYDVKYRATDPKGVYDEIAELEFPDGAWSHAAAPSTFLSDTTMMAYCEGETRTLNIHVVQPSFNAKDIPSIKASSDYNATKTSLVNYIYQYRALEQTSSAYDAAMGTAPTFELQKYTISNHVMQGTTYTLSQYFMEQEIKQTLTVKEVEQDEPSVSFSALGVINCSPETVEYSTDFKSWKSIRSGTTFPSTYYGDTVYFRTPASSYATASDYIEKDIKEARTAPTAKPVLSSTSFSVTLDNAAEYSGCEFSINGTDYSSATTWSNLVADTKYTIYVRYKTTTKFFASGAVTATTSTKEAAKNAITYTTSNTASTTYFLAEGTTKLTNSSKTLSATYSTSTTNALSREIAAAAKKQTVVTVLDVTMEIEEGDTREYEKVKFTMPSGMGLLQLRLNTPYCTLIVDDASTYLEITPISTSSKVSGLKDFVAGKDLVYKVTSQGKGSIQVLYPWEFQERADLSGLRVTYTDAKYKSTQTLAYQEVPEGIVFTMPDDGYFAIENLHKDYGTLSFTDCQTHWAYSYIYWAYDNGLVTGISELEFSPDTLVTRSQIAVLLARLAGADKYAEYTTPYTDVDMDSWYGWAVGFLYELGALKDMGDELFGPEESITREQTAALINKVFPYAGTVWRPMNVKDRNSISTYALNAVDGLYNRNVFRGDNLGNFNPTGTLSRGEFVTILYRLAMSGGGMNVSS